MTVKRRADAPTKTVFLHRLADIRGGVGIKTSNLGGDFLHEGTPISAPENGLCEVVKIARVSKAVTAAATEIEVDKGCQFKVGDFVMSKLKGKAYAITAIDKTNDAKDVITVGTALGEKIEVGGYIFEAEKESADNKSALKVIPAALCGTGNVVKQGDNIFTDAWVIAVTHDIPLPDEIAEHLKGIINI